MRSLVISERSAVRLERAAEFLQSVPADGEALLLGHTFEAVAELSRGLKRPLFGWRRSTLLRCALELARPALLERGLAVASPLALEALWGRVAHALGSRGALERLAPLEGRPGLPRALARTVGDLRMLGVGPDALEPALAAAMRAFEAALAEAKLVDRALVFAQALAMPLPSAPLLVLDVQPAAGAEANFLAALIRAAGQGLVLVPSGDELALEGLRGAVDAIDRPQPAAVPSSALAALQANLFSARRPPQAHPFEDFFSAPGEAQECVEIARRVLAHARAGVPFDAMAVLLRSPSTYRAPLEDALRRAGVPAFFASGLQAPDPSGRALLALLKCAEEDLSAKRFGEYLSLAQVPNPDAEGAPPPATKAWAAPDAAQSLLPLALEGAPSTPAPEELVDVEAPVVEGQLRAPRRWENLIIEAAVIGGTDRWQRRLLGLKQRFERERAAPSSSEAQQLHLARELSDLKALTDFALPLLASLAALPARATWGEWLEALTALATRALRHPERTLSVLAELAPMAPVGPLGLPEVRAVLSARLSEVLQPPPPRRFGQLFVAPIDAARGLAFEVVFVPGLAERIFPQKLREDPLLPDQARARISPQLQTSAQRVQSERLALSLAVGAARGRAVLSYPRVDAEHARPRVPSFYALEAARAVLGELPSYELLQRQGEQASQVKLAWPAPDDPARAIDASEFDLAVLDRILRAKDSVKGRGRYLIHANPHLPRALRARYARWSSSTWTPWDGLVGVKADGRAALAPHQPSARAFSPTALQLFAACPYKFFLSTLLRLSPLEVPGALEELGPLEKGSMAHETQYLLLAGLRDQGLAVTPQALDEIFARLDVTIAEVSQRFFDEYKPAIARVWNDGVETLRADLREWLRRTAADLRFKPWRFELAFGLANREQQDPASVTTPVALSNGFKLRGSIDLVEQGEAGSLRATDYKTGKARAKAGNVIGGGRSLQPVIYALVLEQLFPSSKVEGGRLLYCTQVGEFTEVSTALDAGAREAFGTLTLTLRKHLEEGFFPAAPEPRECTWCDFRAVCGPNEERRIQQTKKGLRPDLASLRALRLLK